MYDLPVFQVTTNVESNIRTSGWVFAILCCFCGSWLVSLMVLWLPGFRKFSHYCSRCGSVEVKLSKSIIALLKYFLDLWWELASRDTPVGRLFSLSSSVFWFWHLLLDLWFIQSAS